MKRLIPILMMITMLITCCPTYVIANTQSTDTLMLEDFTAYTDFTLMNPIDNGYAMPTFEITETGVDQGEALQVNWASTATLKSYVHQLLPQDVWSKETFAQNADNYSYLRLWINNPTFIKMDLTVRLFSNNTKVYMNTDQAIVSRKDGVKITHVVGDATGAGDNSSLEIPSGFAGWVAYPIRLDATTGARGRDNITSFSEVNQVEINLVRPETFDTSSYYILDDICLSNLSVGTLQTTDDGGFDDEDGQTFESKIKNVIVLVGDGMGQTTLKAARNHKGGPLAIDGMEYQSTTISSNNVYDELTDSSAGGTALSCGIRTVNGHVALDSNKNSVENMVEFFSRAGKKTGLVTTSYLLDATPTCYGSRGIRGSYATLGKGLFENNISVLLGGGTDYFNTSITHAGQSYTLLECAQEIYNYTYVDDASELRNFNGEKVLGLFGSGYMDYEVDRDNTQMSIAEMTEKSLSLLENEEGFFLMVEGGNIDHAAHINDMLRTITDTIAFDEAVRVALEYMEKNPDTLVVVCADHSTGGMAEDNGSYFFTTNDHDMSLTACFASGLGSEYFEGLDENADIALAIRKAAMEAEHNQTQKPVNCDKTKLNAAIQIANRMDESKYTEESYGVLKSALVKAEEVFNNTTVTQATVDEATEQLQKAIENLVKKEDSMLNLEGNGTVKTSDMNNIESILAVFAMSVIVLCTISLGKKKLHR